MGRALLLLAGVWAPVLAACAADDAGGRFGSAAADIGAGLLWPQFRERFAGGHKIRIPVTLPQRYCTPSGRRAGMRIRQLARGCRRPGRGGTPLRPLPTFGLPRAGPGAPQQ